MTYLIDETYDSGRHANDVLPYREFLWDFWSPLAIGHPLTPELLALTPDPLVLNPPNDGGPLEDMFNGKRCWTVSRKAREVIEELEPATHTFISVNLKSSTNGESMGQAYILYIGNTIDAIDIDRTRFLGGMGQAGFAKDKTPRRGQVAIQEDLVRGKHLWRGGTGEVGKWRDPFSGYWFCSDQLKEALESRGVTGWIFHPCL